MRVGLTIWLLLVVLLGFRCADFLHRISSGDFVALAFAEGGDDAYYFFTVARNIAQGHGITIDQVQWTTGFQPLWGLLCSLPFAVAPDRVALGIVYAASVALWLASAGLLLAFVRRDAAARLEAPVAALIVALFLGESQIASTYFNGMETGLYGTLCLGLLIAFHHQLQPSAMAVSVARLVAVGLLAGLTMLARNDAFFLFGCLLAVALLLPGRPRPVRDVLTMGLVAAAVVMPWLIYCQWVTGSPIPQSGAATSASLRGHVALASVAVKVATSVIPVFLPKVQSAIDGHAPLALAMATAVAGAIAWRLRRNGTSLMDRPARRVLLGLAAADLAMLVYYPLFSSAGQFFPRYFVPIKLLALILLSLALVRLWGWFRRPAIAGAAAVAIVLAAVGAQLYWIVRDFSLPYRSHLGREAYDIVRSPYAGDGSRLGLAESGRLGFLYPTRVVNLDGKVNIRALRALRDGSFVDFLTSANLDYIMLHNEDLAFFDRKFPRWRNSFRPAGLLGEFEVFARVPAAR